MYSLIAKRSLYFTADKYKNEILRIGNTKSVGLIAPPALVDVGLGEVYKAPDSKLLRWQRFPASQSPQPVQTPRTSHPALLAN